MIPLAKGELKDKIRPLGLGHVLRRIATRSLAKVFLERVKNVVGERQAGLGMDQGAELTHKLVATALLLFKGAGFLGLDVTAAFTSIKRE